MSKSLFICSFHSVQAQLDSQPQSIIRVMILDNRHDKRLNSLQHELTQHNIAISKSSKQQLDKLSNGKKHQGVVAEILSSALPNQHDLAQYLAQYLTGLKSGALMLVLDSIQDPRNLGACLRSANAAGVDCVIINKDGSAPINALVHQTAAGALNHLKIFQVTNLSRTIKALQKHNIWVIGLDGDCAKTLYQIDLTTSVAIVMGSEGSGLRKLTKTSCDELCALPMQGNVESLNVSVATGISLFEANRQRLINPAIST